MSAGRARRQPGSGLGLAIVRQVAEAHGGGAALLLRLPVLQAVPAPVSARRPGWTSWP
jgi:signal transduction histidine kinase